MRLAPHQATFQDNPYKLGLFGSNSVEKDFMRLQNFNFYEEELPSEDDVKFTIIFQLAKEKIVSQRSVYNIFEYASDLGGL